MEEEMNESPLVFLERVYQAYRKYTDLDPKAPKTMKMKSSFHVWKYPWRMLLRFQQSLESSKEEETKPIPEKITEKLSKAVWADRAPGQARFAAAISVTVKSLIQGEKKQYPLEKEAVQGIQLVLN